MDPKEEKNQQPKDSGADAGNGEGHGEDNGKGSDPARVSSKVSTEEQLQKEMLYLRAEFENYKRRILREQDTAIKFANEKLLGEILSVVDLFDRAMGSAKPLKAKAEGSPVATDVNNFVMGIEMTQRELANVLGRFGVEFTGAQGEKFDPSRHEAISELETTADKVGTVLEVLQKGCLLQGRLLKPARVVVGKAKE